MLLQLQEVIRLNGVIAAKIDDVEGKKSAVFLGWIFFVGFWDGEGSSSKDRFRGLERNHRLI